MLMGNSQVRIHPPSWLPIDHIGNKNHHRGDRAIASCQCELRQRHKAAHRQRPVAHPANMEHRQSSRSRLGSSIPSIRASAHEAQPRYQLGHYGLE